MGPLVTQLSVTSCHFQDPRPTLGSVPSPPCPSMSNPTSEPLAWLRPVAQGLPSLPSLPSQAVSTGGGGHVHLLRRAMAQLTYCSLCPPDDLADRGLLGIPSALYAHDALQLWGIIARWVTVGAGPGRGRAGLPPDVSMGPNPTWKQEGPDRRGRNSVLGREGRVRRQQGGSEAGETKTGSTGRGSRWWLNHRVPGPGWGQGSLSGRTPFSHAAKIHKTRP